MNGFKKKKKNAVVSTKYDFKLFLLIRLVPESKVNACVDPPPSTARDVNSLTIKDNLVIYLLQEQRRRSVLKREVEGGGRGGSSSNQPYAYPYSNFPNCPLRCSLAQAIISQCLVCPSSICDNASVLQLFRRYYFVVPLR